MSSVPSYGLPMPGGGGSPTFPGALPPINVPGAGTPGLPTPGGEGGGGGLDWGAILGAITGGLGKLGDVDWGSLLGKVGNFAKDNSGSLALGGLAAAQAIASAKASQRASGFQDQAIDLANKNWAAGDPFRTKSSAALLNPSHSDASTLFAAGASNPFTNPTQRRINGPAVPPIGGPPDTTPWEPSNPGGTLAPDLPALPMPPALPSRPSLMAPVRRRVNSSPMAAY